MGRVGAGININAPSGGLLDAWIDFNDDGTFDGNGERIASSLNLAAGNSFVGFIVPPDAVSDRDLIARYRISSAGGLGPRG